MDPITAARIANLGWMARLLRWQIATVLIIGVLSIALGGWAIYSFKRGQECDLHVYGIPMAEELEKNFNLLLESRAKAEDQLTDTERRLQAEMDDWRRQIKGPQEECKKQWSAWRWFSMIDPIPRAYAQGRLVDSKDVDFKENVRLMVVIGIFSTLAVFFFVCLGALLFSTNTAVITFAADSVKSLLGFFIGVGMSFMGVGGK